VLSNEKKRGKSPENERSDNDELCCDGSGENQEKRFLMQKKKKKRRGNKNEIRYPQCAPFPHPSRPSVHTMRDPYPRKAVRKKRHLKKSIVFGIGDSVPSDVGSPRPYCAGGGVVNDGVSVMQSLH
jgi:hypothetical protein